MAAIGRTANTKYLNLEKIGVETNKENLKVLGKHGGEFEKTSIDNIYALGDVLEGVPELTTVA